jgi:hypothetical protein
LSGILIFSLWPLALAAPAGEPDGTSTKSANPAARASAPSRMTRENFDRIHNGMTEQEVIEILGPARGSSTKTVTQNGHTNQKKKLAWRQYQPGQYKPSLTITVTISNEKVSGKNWIQITPKEK